ncbi:MAG TPA: DUF72 domain-containing protein [Candidatus Sulfotelmatobacter sp.]|nr:DUF72 domain-containing protein [Candidatus Sulfotelmatobacter sp.]
MAVDSPSLAPVHIGTSGWHYKHWKGPFYPADLASTKWLPWYVEHFDTVEINNSFYRLPATSALELWCRQTPANFCFAVKASRYITHNQKLKDPQNAVDKFLTVIDKLERRLGPILFQLPPSWKLNVERLDEFLFGLPPSHRYVFEFRNQTSNTPQVYEVLRRHNAAFCIYELAGFQSPLEITADFTYIRLHGPGNKYQGDYGERVLLTWANRIDAWRKTLRHIFIYFDNDQSGFAAKNALELKQMVLGR